MKKYIMAGVALVTSFSSVTFADNYNGPYAGLTLGANAFKSSYTQTSPDVPVGGASQTDNSDTLFNYGLMAGYGVTCGQFYMGGELLLALQNGQTKYTSKSGFGNNTFYALATIKEDLSINPVVRLGMVISPKVLLFAKFGLAGTQMKVNALPQNAPNSAATTYKKTLWGYSMGVGLETYVVENISVRLDYTYNIYPSQTFKIQNTTTPANVNQGKIGPRDNIVRLGVSYNFSL